MLCTRSSQSVAPHSVKELLDLLPKALLHLWPCFTRKHNSSLRVSLNSLLQATHSATGECKRGKWGGETERERVQERATNPSPPSAQTLGFTGLSRRPEVCSQSTTAIYDLLQCTISLCGLLKQRQHNLTVAALFEVICCHSKGKVRGAILAKKMKWIKKCVFVTGDFLDPLVPFFFFTYYSKELVPFFQPCLTFPK